MTEKIILGIDEVGRGPWAGPLVVGAVILGSDFKTLPECEQLTDSKKLTAKKREILNELILKHAAATGLGWVSAEEIDHYGLGPALKLAARRAVKPILAQISTNVKSPKSQISANLKTAKDPDVDTHLQAPKTDRQPADAPSTLTKFDEILIDGTINLLADTPLADKVTLLPKADFLIKEVSAASIIAKVARDHYMADLAEKYPGYGFEKHVGYGTAAHKSALLDLGPCPEHRKSFRPIADLLAREPGKTKTQALKSHPQTSASPAPASKIPTKPATTTSRGQKAEQIVLEYLKTEHNHTIIAHNFKTKSYEIDLISTIEPNPSEKTDVAKSSTTPSQKAGPSTIYFTEVKYRKSALHGSPLSAITPKKRQQIRFATEAFLAQHPEFQNCQPILAAASVSGPGFHLDAWLPLDE